MKLLLFKCIGISIIAVVVLTIAADELPFVVIIPSYNNEQYCEKNLGICFYAELF